MCGQRLSTAKTSPFSASRQIVCPSSATTRRPASRSSSSEAARRRRAVSTTVTTTSLEPQLWFKSSGRRALDRRGRNPQRSRPLRAALLRARGPDRLDAHRRQPAPLRARDAQAHRLHPGRPRRGSPARRGQRRAGEAPGATAPRAAATGSASRTAGAPTSTSASRPSRRCSDRLTTCIGCGCLSIDKCELLNPDDEAAEQGPGRTSCSKTSPEILAPAVDPATVQALAETENARFAAERPRSAELTEQARRSMPRGVPMAWMDDLYDHPPVWIDRGEGATFTDVDGHTYLDMYVADMSAFCGHAPPQVVETVAAANRPREPVPDAQRGRDRRRRAPRCAVRAPEVAVHALGNAGQHGSDPPRA